MREKLQFIVLIKINQNIYEDNLLHVIHYDFHSSFELTTILLLPRTTAF